MKPSYELHRRDLTFGMKQDIPRCWIAGESQSTRWFDAFSCVTQPAERFFIETLRHFLPQLPDNTDLARDVTAFIGQEAVHSREHAEYNERLIAQRAPAREMIALVSRHFTFFQKYFTHTGCLAITICLENLTATLGLQIIEHPSIFRDADPRMRKLWTWHSFEEVEHRSVAFDVFIHVVPNAVMRYFLRVLAMLMTAAWATTIHSYIRYRLLRSDGKTASFTEWHRSVRRMYLHPGMLSHAFLHSLKWFIPGFHPSKYGNTLAMQTLRKKYDAAAEASSPKG